MADTAKLNLPLLSPSQAQKHVTVNEALGRLDAAVQLSVISRVLTTPPVIPEEGDTYLVAPGSINAWAGEDGKITVYQNGGWIFLVPNAGWQAYVADEGERLVFDGTDWLEGAMAIAPGGSAFAMRVNEFDHPVTAGATSTTGFEILPDTIVFGVTGRVISDVTGTLTSYRMGVSGSDDRYGSGLGISQNAWARGLTGTPLTYYAATEILLTAEGGTFDGNGVLRLAVHYAELGLPRLV